ncbi:MAG TPA: tetratricopeptide repeat protein, partial [Actinomycetota bacterium]
GQVLDLPAAALAFTEDEVAELLRAVLGEEPGDLAGSLHRLTEGWPAAVRLGAEVAASTDPEQRTSALEALSRPGSPVFDYFAREVLGAEEPHVLGFLRTAALLDAFSPELCAAIGVEDAERTIADLSSRGLFFEPRGEGWFELSPLIRGVVERSGPGGGEAAALLTSAAKWLLEAGRIEDALGALLRAEDLEGVAAALEEHGEGLIAGGSVEAVIRSIEPLPADLRSPALDRLEGEARQIRGDWDRALACFLRAAPEGGPLDAGLAWRMGLIHHLRGDLGAALDMYERGRVDREDRDVALLLAWSAAAHWLRGDLERSRETAGRARDVAAAVGDERAEAAAFTTLAMVAALEGDRRANDAYYLRALDAAERARDVLQIVRIRTNRASRFSEEGDHEDALRELDLAVGLAELTGFANFHALGVHNRGQARLGLGRLEEARTDFESALALYQRMGSRMVAYPLAGLADISRTRGDLAQARAAYEEAVAVAEEAGDLQGLVPAMAGLARVLAAEDPEAARKTAERAVELGRGMGYVQAQLALGWVALASGERDPARGAAQAASEAARERRDRPGLAEALTLAAMTDPDEPWVPTALEEAAGIWREVGNPLEEAIVGIVASGLGGPTEAGPSAERARRRLRAYGVRLPAAAQPAGPLHLLSSEEPSLVIQALGGFRVLRGGRAVPAS